MGKSCTIYKRCSICLKVKHNLEFESHKMGRTGVKPYCKACKPIYKGIKEGLIPEDKYIGFDYDTTLLTGDVYGNVIFLEETSFKKISVEQAIRMVHQGAAFITSESTIQAHLSNVLEGKTIKQYVMERDKNKCHYCINEATTIDHVIPKFNGGLDTPLNLVACCSDCNELKGNMSKDEFIHRLTNGDYDYFTRSWKAYVPIKTLSKKCKTCGLEKEISQFEKQEVNCKVCTKIYNAVTVGLITKEELKGISKTYFSLKENIVNVIDKEGKTLRKITLEKANEWLEKGIAYTQSENSVKLLFDEDGVKRLYPGFKLYKESNKNTKEKNRTGLINYAKLSKTLIVHTKTREKLCTVPRTVAVDLIEKDLVNVISANSLVLKKDLLEITEYYEPLKQHIPKTLV